ncbi:hypothetical protein PAMA_016966 [Pampus argenteus]
MVSPSQKPSVYSNMAALGKYGGHCIQKNSRFLLSNLEQLWGHRSFGWTPALRQQAAEANKESTETIVIPRKKTWSNVAVLEALASTVSKDPTAYHYQFQDDSYLSPRTTYELKLFALSQEAGRSAAKYFVNTNPKFFTKDFAEPHIPCLMPETVSLLLEEVSEEALKERIHLRKVTAAIDMYDQLLQAGTAVSMETSHELLDLICFFGDSDPVEGEELQMEDSEEFRMVKKKTKFNQPSNLQCTWKDDNNAERIFNLLPERDTRCYSALIRGMVKYGAYDKALSMFTEMLNNRLTGDVHIFNALISVTPKIQNTREKKWDLILELLTQMSQQKVQPNLLTFNTVLKCLSQCGPTAKTVALSILTEMKAIGIAPSLATYTYILWTFFKTASCAERNTDILQEMMLELEGTSFTCQDPDDIYFFGSAIKICLQSKDLELGYKVQSLVEVGENWRLLGDSFESSIYFGRFFSLLCQMEHIDVVLKWYARHVPSLFYPNSQGLRDLMQALDTDDRLDFLPAVWKEIQSLRHVHRPNLLEELISLMARDKHSPEVQESFAMCALEIKNVYESASRAKYNPTWSSMSLSNITTLLLRANKTQQAWDMLKLFKANNKVPSDDLLEDFLSVCRSDSSPQRAVELVQLSASFCLQSTQRLATRALAEFDLTEEQR